MNGNTPQSVKYIGLFAVRQIRDFEWKSAGVKGQGTVVWNNLNGWTLPGDKFTLDALKAMKEDGSFVLLYADEEESEEHDPEEAPTQA